MYSKRIERVSNCRGHRWQRRFTQTVYIGPLPLDKIMGKKLGEVTGSGNIVVGEIGVCSLALFKMNFFEKGRAKTHDHRSFVLQFCAWAIDYPPRVDRRVEPEDLEFSCFFIDTDLGGAGALMPMA